MNTNEQSSNNKPRPSAQEGIRQSVNKYPENKRGFTIETPQIEKPKGGGAIKGIDEKFRVNPNNGTLSFSIPLPFSEGRGGFTPNLQLSYNSGSGNGIFGLGWNLNFPAIQRKTEKQLPRYDQEESDTFMLTGLEDLVPRLAGDSGNQQSDEFTVEGGYHIKRYRPRIERDFSRIEKVWHPKKGTWWKVTSPENVVTFFGRSEDHKIMDPSNASRVFKWLPELKYDDKGNCMRLEFKREDGKGADGQNPARELHNRNRYDANGQPLFTNEYLKKILYTNQTPYLPDASNMEKNYDPHQAPPPAEGDFLMEAIFDYGEHGILPKVEEKGSVEVKYEPEANWPFRNDAFSGYRSGFEIRTARLCQRVLMYHHFKELGPPCLVRSIDFHYRDWKAESQPALGRKLEATYLDSVIERGYIKQDASTERYTYKSIPPMEFDYQELEWDTTIRKAPEDATSDAPVGLSGNYRWIDLYNEGISGILTEQGNGWHYKENLGGGEFAPAREVMAKPSFTGLNSGTFQLQDLEANGQQQVVMNEPGAAGYFELTEENGWEPFAAFDQDLNLDLSDPNVRSFDLNGDGRAEVVITEEGAFIWYPSAGKKGYDPAEKAFKALDEEQGPAVVFAESTQTIFLADMTGDGLTDITRIKNGEVCYWPNLGYGRFGTKVTMNDSPWFDHQDLFDPSLIKLVDISGTGVSDLIYTGGQKFKAWLNLSGNEWSEPCVIDPFPDANNATNIRITDFLGNGTSSIVWSSPLPSDQTSPLRYIDLMGGKKPHVLHAYRNNLGKEVRWQYRSSIHFYLEDKKDGKPWVTKLPFPTQVIEKVETFDHISRNRFVERYAYHHGYYDHTEQEFRGFGMVEQWDTEAFGAFEEKANAGGLNWQKDTYVPPVYTKTWFHTGAYTKAEEISRRFKKEYWIRDEKDLLPDTILPENLSAEESREAARALKGSLLRKEVYARDETDKSELPYQTSERSYRVRLLQPRKYGQYAVFLKYPAENFVFHFERHPGDPRKKHTLNLEVDAYGNVLKSAEISYGKEKPDPDLSQENQKIQGEKKIVYTENKFTNAYLGQDAYRVPLPCESNQYELTGIHPDNRHFAVEELQRKIIGNQVKRIAYEKTPSATQPTLRCIHKQRSLFMKDDLSGALPFQKAESRALPYKNYRLALTKGQVDKYYKNRPHAKNVSNMLNEAGYVRLTNSGMWGSEFTDPDNWWIPTGQISYAPDDGINELTHATKHFFQPHRELDPFNNTTHFRYDDYNLLLVETIDPLGNSSKVGDKGNSYRVLQPEMFKDENDNHTEWKYDALGLVQATAIMGKEADNDNRLQNHSGDALKEMKDEPDDTDFKNPSENGPSLMGKATKRLVYDLFAYRRGNINNHHQSSQPPFVWTMDRELHVNQGTHGAIQHQITYSDGFDRKIQTKKIAAPPEGHTDTKGAYWIASGWKVFNNKGKPVREYEPFYSDTHKFEFKRKEGVSPVIFYDPLDRIIAILHPDNTYEKVAFESWKQVMWDRNDTLANQRDENNPMYPWKDLDIKGYVKSYFDVNYPNGNGWQTWLEQKSSRSENEDLIRKTIPHSETPEFQYLDAMGHLFLRRQVNNAQGQQPEALFHKTLFDIEGQEQAVIDFINQGVQNQVERIVMKYDYDVVGNRINQPSMETGERWMLKTIDKEIAYKWDSKKQQFRNEYDEVRRPLNTWLKRNNDEGQPKEKLVEKRTYGESITNPKKINLRGEVYEVRDQAGVITYEAYDFKSNLLKESRHFAKEYKKTLDWSQPNVYSLESNPEIQTEYITQTKFDALNRPMEKITPDGRKTIYSYNITGLLKKISINLNPNTDQSTIVIRNITYDAKGRRKNIQYGNGTLSMYEYDPQTFRLVKAESRKKKGNGKPIQSLQYTYDPMGNVVYVENKAEQSIFFNNQQIEPHSGYTYDALYQLIKATGREHLGQNQFVEPPKPFNTFHTDFGVQDKVAMGRYTESYEYDKAGNIKKLHHKSKTNRGHSWTRKYTYKEKSLINGASFNNRLTKTIIRGTEEKYNYNVHGCITSMPHLSDMEWDFQDQLKMTQKTKLTNGTPETTWYVYDHQGQRIRKVTERQNNDLTVSTKKEERYYVGDFEIYRKYNQGEMPKLERETLHVQENERRVAMVDIKTVDNTGNRENSPTQLVRYLMPDSLNTIVVELNSEEKVISYEEYFPYGSTSYQAKNNVLEVPIKRYRYNSKERDEENGFYYYGARYYSSWLGRWISTDPIGIQDGLNLYVYTLNNPSSLKDQEGTQASGKDQSSKLIKEQAQKATKNIEKVSGKYTGMTEEGVPYNKALGGNWPYNERVQNRENLGKNVQRDHAVMSKVRETQRKTPSGNQKYSRSASRSAGELTVLAETGKGDPKSGEPAKPHTMKSNLEREKVQKPFERGEIKSEGELICRVQQVCSEVNQKVGGYPKENVNMSILSNQSTVNQSTEETAQEMRQEFENPEKISKDVDEAINKLDEEGLQSKSTGSSSSSPDASKSSGGGTSLGRLGRMSGIAFEFLGIGADIFDAYNMSKSHEEKGTVSPSPGVEVITDPSKVRDGVYPKLGGGTVIIENGKVYPGPI